MASPNKEYLLRTRNNPITEHKIAIAVPAINALCIKLKAKISRDIVSDDAYVPALMLQNIVLQVLHFQRIHQRLHEKIVFYLDRLRGWLID